MSPEVALMVAEIPVQEAAMIHVPATVNLTAHGVAAMIVVVIQDRIKHVNAINSQR